MPDDDTLIGQNLVETRREERIFACRNPEYDWITEARDLQAEQDLAQALDHQRRLHEAVPVSPEADRRRQEALARNLREIQRLMGS